VSRDPEYLRAGELGTPEVTASTVANTGPGIDFYLAFGVITVTAGIAAPLTIGVLHFPKVLRLVLGPGRNRARE
jgi:hypothetical protein